MSRTLRTAALLASLALPLTACGGGSPDPGDLGGAPSKQPGTVTTGPGADDDQQSLPPGRPRVVRTVADGLEVPWGVAFLPGGAALVGERDSTRVLRVTAQGNVREVGRIDEAAPRGEAGLLGLAVSPSYDEDRSVFAYVTTEQDNRVLRMSYEDGRLGEAEPILTGIPSAFIHDGGRLLFDDEGMLLVSTGEAGEPPLAQRTDSLGGKILRITPDGEPAPDNPRGDSPLWTLGHRNVQGLAFDDQGRLWATEFGEQTWDELNLIRKGDNYGWPQVEGKGEQDEFRNPHVTWSTSDASPSGLAYLDGSLWAGALRGERLWQIPVTDDGVGEPRGWFVGDHGRIRTVTATPRGTLWVTTSNRDGRGDPAPEDDRILEVAVERG
jgi:glucose/arabinose dehydrogenase